MGRLKVWFAGNTTNAQNHSLPVVRVCFKGVGSPKLGSPKLGSPKLGSPKLVRIFRWAGFARPSENPYLNTTTKA